MIDAKRGVKPSSHSGSGMFRRGGLGCVLRAVRFQGFPAQRGAARVMTRAAAGQARSATNRPTWWLRRLSGGCAACCRLPIQLTCSPVPGCTSPMSGLEHGGATAARSAGQHQQGVVAPPVPGGPGPGRQQCGDLASGELGDQGLGRSAWAGSPVPGDEPRVSGLRSAA